MEIFLFCFSATVSVCPLSFTCTLNCRLGYKTDSNGCLLCECQSCPLMDQCNKNCPSGYLKDLFGCDICECSDQCPPFSCGIICPPDVGFEKSSNGCPLCQCARTKSKPTEYTSSCQVLYSKKQKIIISLFFLIRMMFIVLQVSDVLMMHVMCQCVKQVYYGLLVLFKCYVNYVHE